MNWISHRCRSLNNVLSIQCCLRRSIYTGNSREKYLKRRIDCLFRDYSDVWDLPRLNFRLIELQSLMFCLNYQLIFLSQRFWWYQVCIFMLESFCSRKISKYGRTFNKSWSHLTLAQKLNKNFKHNTQFCNKINFKHI